MTRIGFLVVRALCLTALAFCLLGITARSAWASKATSEQLGPPDVLDVPHQAPAYFYAPKSHGAAKPVIVWLHGRGGNPEADCRKWARVARDYGWVLCPSGPENRGGGRGWNNSWPQAKATVDAAMFTLRAKYGKRVRLKNNVLIGFSEGALVGMNIGVREPDVFSRWLILAASDVYWGGEGLSELKRNCGKLRRVYLLTGEKDGVVENTRRVYKAMENESVHVRIWTPDDIGHEVPADRMRTFYRKPLRWLVAAK
jgi:predicted esterase